MSIIFLLYVPKLYFSDVNVGKLEESSRATLPFRRVCLWRHNLFTRETGRVACHPPPCGWQAGHSGQIVWKTLWIWEKLYLIMLTTKEHNLNVFKVVYIEWRRVFLFSTLLHHRSSCVTCEKLSQVDKITQNYSVLSEINIQWINQSIHMLKIIRIFTYVSTILKFCLYCRDAYLSN